MKKYLLSFAVLAMGMSLLTACSDDDDEPQKQAVDVSNGLFIVGSGNKSAGIDGNVSYIDYTKGSTVADIFQTANGKSIGKTGNHISAYGSKLYIVVDGEATVWVCNKQTLKIEKQISTTQLLGDKDGLSPRAAIGYDGRFTSPATARATTARTASWPPSTPSTSPSSRPTPWAPTPTVWHSSAATSSSPTPTTAAA